MGINLKISMGAQAISKLTSSQREHVHYSSTKGTAVILGSIYQRKSNIMKQKIAGAETLT